MKLQIGRGGSWYDLADFCRSAYRVRIEPSLRHYYLGFRIAQKKPMQKTGSRVLRGGSFNSLLDYARADSRCGCPPSFRKKHRGFRIAQRRKKS